MKDYLWLLLALSPFAAVALFPLSIVLFDGDNYLSIMATSFLLTYGLTGVVRPGNRTLLRHMVRHGIHNDR